jgi:alpha-1,6-mannosyltransferase
VGPAGWLAAAARGLGLDRVGTIGLIEMSLAVLAAMVVAWIRVLVAARRGRLSVRSVLLAGAVAVAVAVLAPVLLSRDVYSYAAYGRILSVRSANPYLVAPAAFPTDPFTRVASAAWVHQPSLYGPVFVLLAGGLARAFSGSAGALMVSFKVVSGLGLLGAAACAMAACAPERPDRRALVATCVVLNPVLVVHAVGGGHNDTLLALAVAGAAAVAVRATRRPWTTSAVTVLLCLAGLVKLPALVLLAPWLWSIRRDRPGSSGLRSAAGQLGVAAVVLAAFVVPFSDGGRALRAFVTLGSLEGWASGVRLVARGAEALGGSTGGAAVRAAFLAVFAVALWRVSATSTRPGAPNGWGRAELGLAVSVPYLLPWYASWFAPLLAFVEDRVLWWAGVAVCGILALTGVPAEPGPDPGAWRDMVSAVHYGAGPVVLALFALVMARLLRQGAIEPDHSGGAITTSRLPSDAA